MTTKNIIFCTGNGCSEYRTVAENLERLLYRSVLIDEPFRRAGEYEGIREIAARKSIFFSQALFYGSLPSRKNVIVSTPNLTMKTLIQFLVLFEKIKKNVFIVVDDRHLLTQFNKDKYDKLRRTFPPDNIFFVSEIQIAKPLYSKNVLEELAKRIKQNSKFVFASTIHTFNEILSKVPELFREEFKKMIFGTDFGDIPFEKVNKCLLPEFNDVDDEEMEEEEEEKKESEVQAKKVKITDYFMPEVKEEEPPKILKDEVRRKEDEENDEELTPILDEESQTWFSLLEFYDDDDIQPSQLR